MILFFRILFIFIIFQSHFTFAGGSTPGQKLRDEARTEAERLGRKQEVSAEEKSAFEARINALENRDLLKKNQSKSKKEKRRKRIQDIRDIATARKFSDLHQADPSSVGGMCVPIPRAVLPYRASQTSVDGHYDPTLNSSERTKELALKQSLSARNMLYFPDEQVSTELLGAATSLRRLFGAIPPSELSHLLRGFRFRIGPDAKGRPSDIGYINNLLDRVINNRATGFDRATLLGLVSDIGGTLYWEAEAGARTGGIAPSALRTALTSIGLYPPGISDFKRIMSVGGSQATGPRKDALRVTIGTPTVTRSGIHDTGRQADALIQRVHPTEAIEALPNYSWPVSYLQRRDFEGRSEPLVGRMSGASIIEMMTGFDVLRGVQAQDQFSQAITAPSAGLDASVQRQREARVSAAASFMLGVGFHSALEVLEPVQAYLGLSYRSYDTLSTDSEVQRLIPFGGRGSGGVTAAPAGLETHKRPAIESQRSNQVIGRQLVQEMSVTREGVLHRNAMDILDHPDYGRRDGIGATQYVTGLLDRHINPNRQVEFSSVRREDPACLPAVDSRARGRVYEVGAGGEAIEGGAGAAAQ